MKTSPTQILTCCQARAVLLFAKRSLVNGGHSNERPKSMAQVDGLKEPCRTFTNGPNSESALGFVIISVRPPSLRSVKSSKVGLAFALPRLASALTPPSLRFVDSALLNWPVTPWSAELPSCRCSTPPEPLSVSPSFLTLPHDLNQTVRTINRYPTCRPRPPLASSSLLLCSPWSAPAPIRPSLVTRVSSTLLKLCCPVPRLHHLMSFLHLPSTCVASKH